MMKRTQFHRSRSISIGKRTSGTNTPFNPSITITPSKYLSTSARITRADPLFSSGQPSMCLLRYPTSRSIWTTTVLWLSSIFRITWKGISMSTSWLPTTMDSEQTISSTTSPRSFPRQATNTSLKDSISWSCSEWVPLESGSSKCSNRFCQNSSSERSKYLALKNRNSRNTLWNFWTLVRCLRTFSRMSLPRKTALARRKCTLQNIDVLKY